ncbi:hypothetical protein IAD21_02217 [Abditibacteriota bacterium]|nr:hypothetical protein IAD21_02217 [Abditibacteriota bacterium]
MVRADVASVRREVARIDAMKLTTESRQSDGLVTHWTFIDVFRDSNRMPRKISTTCFIGEVVTHETIYLQGGTPLFVLSNESTITGTLRTQTRLYFDKGRLIEKRVGKKSLPLSAAQKRNIETNTQKRIRTYLSLYQLV